MLDGGWEILRRVTPYERRGAMHYSTSVLRDVNAVLRAHVDMFLVAFVGGLLLSGCTTRQLAWHTAELGPSITKIEEDQILTNISRFIDACPDSAADDSKRVPCRGVVPDQFVLGGGQAQVSNQQQGPNVTANLIGQAIKSLTLQDQNQWTQSWSITPVTDFADLERLRLLYSFAVSRRVDDKPDGAKQFVDAYTSTLVRAIDPAARIPALMSAPDADTPTKLCLADFQLPLPGQLSLSPSKCPEAWSWSDLAKDWTHRLPTSRWIYWDKTPPVSGLRHVGRYGRHTLYVNDADLQDFMIWILGATPNTSATGGKSGGGGKTGSGALDLTPIR
jgi:hypothetical protein